MHNYSHSTQAWSTVSIVAYMSIIVKWVQMSMTNAVFTRLYRTVLHPGDYDAR